MHAVEIDPLLAGALPATVADAACRSAADRLTVAATPTRCGSRADELARPRRPRWSRTCPTTSPYRWCCTCWPSCRSLRHGLVMVQKEVADRLTAGPGSKVYGVPSGEARLVRHARAAGKVPPSVFWPVPNVDSGLVAFTRREPPRTPTGGPVFAVIDAAFAQRRKTLRAALAGWAGGAGAAEAILAPGGGRARRRAARPSTWKSSPRSPRGRRRPRKGRDL